MCSGSMSGGAGSFDAGGEYAELRCRDLDLSGPDNFAISLIDREVHKAFRSFSSAASIKPWLLDSTPIAATKSELLDPQRLCCKKGASVPGGVGPFGLLVLASCAEPCGARRLCPGPVQEHALRRSSGKTVPTLPEPREDAACAWEQRGHRHLRLL